LRVRGFTQATATLLRRRPESNSRDPEIIEFLSGILTKTLGSSTLAEYHKLCWIRPEKRAAALEL